MISQKLFIESEQFLDMLPAWFLSKFPEFYSFLSFIVAEIYPFENSAIIPAMAGIMAGKIEA